MKRKLKNIDLSIPRRRYYKSECGLKVCPECGSELIEEGCPILLSAKSDSDEAEFMTNHCGSHFCNKCPVVVFDDDMIGQNAKYGIRGDKNLRYFIAGIIDLDSIPENKSHLAIGCEENPVPLVHFLPDLNSQPINADKKPGRNDLCICGSGKKYKKCCG